MEPIRVHIRWMLRRDMEAVLTIDEECCLWEAWSQEQFFEVLRERNVIGQVAEADGGEVVGFMVYALHPRSIYLLSFAVAPKWQRRGIGRQMVEKLKGKLSALRRRELVVDVRESNTAAQRFFQVLGFQGTKVLAPPYGWPYEDAGGGAYRMVYSPFGERSPQ